MFTLIKELAELHGPVGQEQAVLDYIEPIWRGAGAETERTPLGNIIARAGGSGPRLLITAHGDELCYLVRSIDPDGFLWLANGQGWSRTTSKRDWFTVGQRVQVLARGGPIAGVIAAATGHVAALALPEPNELTWNDLWVDTGLTRAELVERGVTPGTRIVWDVAAAQYGPHIVSKALDNRASLAIITEVLRHVPRAERRCDLTLLCTVQEEIGVVGAYAALQRGQYDAAIVVESGLSGDIPPIGERALPVRLGGGPTLVHKDSMVHYDYVLTQAIERHAQALAIPIQHAVFGSFGSDGSALLRANIPTALVAFATRYTHSPFEMAHLGDIEQIVELLCGIVRSGDLGR
jgi:tetrahedral aminopeptidase